MSKKDVKPALIGMMSSEKESYVLLVITKDLKSQKLIPGMEIIAVDFMPCRVVSEIQMVILKKSVNK
jgi:hypothetical protein